MARPIVTPRRAGEVGSMIELQQAPQRMIVPVTFWKGAKGIESTLAPTRVPLEYAADVVNFHVRDGRLETRKGTSFVGGNSSPEIIRVLKFITQSGDGYLLRFATNVIHIWDGTTWQTVAGYTPTGDNTDYFAVAAFGDTLILSNGKDTAQELNLLTAVATAISGAPSFKHATTFNGRIIASDIMDPTSQPGRIQWPVKNNSLDWSGAGSGFEDLKSTPGGSTDRQMLVVPVTDNRALVIRSASIWVMSSTGVLDTPFQFTIMGDAFGTVSRHSVVPVPAGCVGWFRDDVYFVGFGQREDIGRSYKRTIKASITDEEKLIGAYDPLERRYFLGEIGKSLVHVFSFDNKAWTSIDFAGFNLNWIGQGYGALLPLTIQGLSGTIQGLTGTIDDLLGTSAGDPSGMFWAWNGTFGYVSVDDSAQNTDEVLGGTQAVVITAETAPIVAPDGNLMREYEVVQAKLEYECDGIATLPLEYSKDNGGTWTTYGTFSLVLASGVVEVATLRLRVYKGRNIKFRVTNTTNISGLKIHSFTVGAVQTTEVGL